MIADDLGRSGSAVSFKEIDVGVRLASVGLAMAVGGYLMIVVGLVHAVMSMAAGEAG